MEIVTSLAGKLKLFILAVGFSSFYCF
jgi:hypothetical protein